MANLRKIEDMLQMQITRGKKFYFKRTNDLFKKKKSNKLNIELLYDPAVLYLPKRSESKKHEQTFIH